jgi:aminoglycoside phosphotransferase (APT) family kinase protein
MRPVSLPDIPYGATAVRPDWSDLPKALRAAIERRLGAEVAASTTAGGGFTRAFAAVVETATGERFFLKAAPLDDPTAEWYAHEATVTMSLPPEVPAARPLWTLTDKGAFVLCLEYVDGHVPTLPWRPDELDETLKAWQIASDALRTPPPGLRLPPLSEIIPHELSWWSEIAADRVPMPPAPAWVPGRLRDLVELEQNLPGLVAGSGMVHGDLRIDNIMIDAYGKARICDWAWPCAGQPWFDTVTLLITAFAAGLDADALLEPWDAPAEGVDGVLASMGGYWLSRAASGPSSASPHSRQHQRFSGTQAMAWLAARRGWGS